MKSLIRSALCAIIILGVHASSGAVPPINVTVADSAGKLAFKGVTASNGAFATGTLKPGNYVVQFNSRDLSLKCHSPSSICRRRQSCDSFRT